MPSEFRLVERPAFTVVGLRVEATWDQLWVVMPTAWRTLFARGHEIAARVGDSFLDASIERHGNRYTQLIGAEVRSVEAVPSGMIALEIPAQRYIHYRHVGPLPEIARSFGAIYDWASAQGHVLDDFKLDEGYRPDGSERTHDLFVRTTQR